MNRSQFFLLVLVCWITLWGGKQRLVLAESEPIQPRIAVLPFENLSGQFGASEEVMAAVMESLERGFQVIPLNRVDRVLTELRVRHTGFLTTDQIIEIGERLNVRFLLLGIVDTYRKEPRPQVSFFCTLVSTVSTYRGGAGLAQKDTPKDTPILWSKNFYALGQKQVYLLQRKVHTEWSSLIHSVAEDLLRSIPKSRMRGEES